MTQSPTDDWMDALSDQALAAEEWYTAHEWVVTDRGSAKEGIRPNEQLLSYLFDSMQSCGVLDRVLVEDGRIGPEGQNIRLYGTPEDIEALKAVTSHRLTIARPRPASVIAVPDAPAPR